MSAVSRIVSAVTGASGRAKAGAAGGGIVLLLVVAIAALQVMGGASPSPSATPSSAAAASPSASATASPTTEPSASATPGGSASASPTPSPADGAYADLDGVAGAADRIHRLPLAIMIDDNALARPQSGMTAASIVIQAPADGGEVRYLVIFQEGDSKDVGPVRSARPHFATWAAEYRPLYGHFGGDKKLLQKTVPGLVASGSIYNMDALYGGYCPYHRIAARIAPFNAYTNTAILRSCAEKKQYPAQVQQVEHRAFSDDAADGDRPASASISVPYPRQLVTYEYDRARNLYLRSIDGKAEIDAAVNEQVTARNVVVMFQALSIDPESEKGHARPLVSNVGEGKAIVFRDGSAIQATWKKPSPTALTRLYDAAGTEIPLVRGRIFFQVVALGTNVTYKAG